MKLVWELAFQGLLNGCIYALIAVGLVMVYGLLRVLHIAHAGLFTLGAYLSLAITNASGSLALALACSVVAVGLSGVAIFRFCYEPILNRPPYVVLIASIGLFVMMEEAFRIVFGPYGLSYIKPPLQERLNVLGIGVTVAELSVILITLVFVCSTGRLQPADPHRNRFARDRIGPANGRVVRRRYPVDPRHDVLHRLGIRRGGRNDGRRA